LPVDEDACVALLQPWGLAAHVSLVEGDVSVREALTYARVLLEIGRDEEAWEVFEAVLAALMHVPTAAAA
jgi:hypothetical protein